MKNILVREVVNYSRKVFFRRKRGKFPRNLNFQSHFMLEKKLLFAL